MIPKSHKFPLRTEFLTFRSHANRFSSPHFQLLYLPHTPNLAHRSEVGPTPSPARMAVIVPKKANKLAVVRNRLRRLTYDTLWPLVKDKSLDLVIVYKPLKLTKSPATKQTLIKELSNLKFDN